jgi:hypothetical protein
MEASLRRRGESEVDFPGCGGEKGRIRVKKVLWQAFCEWRIVGSAAFRLWEEMAEKKGDRGCGQRLSRSPGLMSFVQRAFRARPATSSLGVLARWKRRSFYAV